MEKRGEWAVANEGASHAGTRRKCGAAGAAGGTCEKRTVGCFVAMRTANLGPFAVPFMMFGWSLSANDANNADEVTRLVAQCLGTSFTPDDAPRGMKSCNRRCKLMGALKRKAGSR